MDLLRQKLEDYTAPPPPGAWDDIEERLGDAGQEHVRRQLTDVAVAPSPHVWTKLEKNLDDNNNVGTERKLVSMTWLRVAAAVILFLGGGWWVAQYVSGNNDNSTALQTSKPETTTNNVVPSPENDTARNDDGSVTANSSNNKNARYVTVAKGGKTVRRSKKLQPLFDCAQLEEPGAVADCRKNLMDLQRRMASSTVNPTSDFAGLLDAIKTLEENR